MIPTTPAAARFRPRLPANALIALVAVFIVLFCNQRLWGLVFASSSGLAFDLVIGTVVFAIIVLLAAPLSFKGAIKPWLAFLLVTAAAANVLTSDFGAVADRHAVASVFETDRREAGEMMSLWVLARIGLLGVDKVRMSDVARDIGVTHAALYPHFADKAALLDAVTQTWLRSVDAAAAAAAAVSALKH